MSDSEPGEGRRQGDLSSSSAECDHQTMADKPKIYPSTARARRLRRDETDAEKAIWRMLRNRQFSALKFRRQHPIGRYFVDFYCHERRLVIEIDGGQHSVERDRKRTEYLEARRLTVLRFWNNEVLANPEGVWEVVRMALEG